MAELRPTSQTKGQERNEQAVETGTGILRRIQGHCPVVQGLGQKGQHTDRAELGKGGTE